MESIYLIDQKYLKIVIVLVWFHLVFPEKFFWHNLILNLFFILCLKLLFRKCATYVVGCSSIKSSLTCCLETFFIQVNNRLNDLMIIIISQHVWWKDKSRGILRTQASIYDEDFLWKYLLFSQKKFIIDARLGS